VAVAEEITSPELILVSPPDLAAQAREALPDFEYEWAQLVERLRAQQAVEDAEETRRHRHLTIGGFAFTLLGALNCVAPLAILIVFRS
jgi:hypothetical protein